MIELGSPYQALDAILGSGYVERYAQVAARAQQDLEHSTIWEVEEGFNYPPDGDGWAPFGSTERYILWRRPVPDSKPQTEKPCKT